MKTFQLLVQMLTLALFLHAIVHRNDEEMNNWWRLGMALYGIGCAGRATTAFSSLQTASSEQLFAFLIYSIASVAGAMLVTTIKRGRWKVVGLLPQWERDAALGAGSQTNLPGDGELRP